MAEASPRWAVVNELVTRLRSHANLADVLVEPGFPGEDSMRRETIWVGQITGEVSIPTMKAGRLSADDMFTIPVYFSVAGLRDLDATMARLGQLGDAVHDVLVDGSNFDGLDGLVSITPQDRSDESGITASDGPLGFGTYTVSGHARIL